MPFVLCTEGGCTHTCHRQKKKAGGNKVKARARMATSRGNSVITHVTKPTQHVHTPLLSHSTVQTDNLTRTLIDAGDLKRFDEEVDASTRDEKHNGLVVGVRLQMVHELSELLIAVAHDKKVVQQSWSLLGGLCAVMHHGNGCEQAAPKHTSIAGNGTRTLVAVLCTLTETTTGLRKPARASSFTSLVCVAENSPVRRCFGSKARMLLMVPVKPRSNRVSASSRTSTCEGHSTPTHHGDIQVQCYLDTQSFAMAGLDHGHNHQPRALS